MGVVITKKFLEEHRKMLLDISREYLGISTEEFLDVIEKEAFRKPVKTFKEQNKMLSESSEVLRVFGETFAKYFKLYKVFGVKTHDDDDGLTQLFDVLVKKNNNYGENNIPEIGLLGVANLIKIKSSREKTTRMNRQVDFEPHKDTILDLANYAILGILLWKGLLNDKTVQ